MNKEELLQYVTDLADEIWETLRDKNSDYTGDAEDAFKNFNFASEFAHVPVERGIMVRVADKIARIRALTRPEHDQKILSEGLEDTVRDLIGYLILYHAYVWPHRYEKPPQPGKTEEPSPARQLWDQLFVKKNATQSTSIR